MLTSDEPPLDYSLDLEIASVLRAADEAGIGRFHPVGYSLAVRSL